MQIADRWTIHCAHIRFANRVQVVELPRDRPELALELFADVPGLRLLIIGGDGTVGWVLSCLDSLQVTQRSEPPLGALGCVMKIS